MACCAKLRTAVSCVHRQLLCSPHLRVARAQVCFYGVVRPRERESSSKYKLVVVGGGSGGCAVAAKFASLGRDVAVIEPSESHYYQPIWTLVGAGLKDFQTSVKPMGEVLPRSCTWVKDRAVKFDPEDNCLELASGDKIHYEYLVLAMGIQLDFQKVKGLKEALDSDPMVVTNYHPQFVKKTFPALKQFKGGNAIFTFPNTPIKCAGAPQKIMYLAEEIFRNSQVRDNTQVLFNSALGVIFGVKKYAAALQKVIEKRGIKTNFRHDLIEVDPQTKTAVFNLLDGNATVPFKYDFLHVTPPMSSPDVLKTSPLVNEAGWVDVQKHTLQHTRYTNVFGIGDCTSLPTSKTGAACASQSGVLYKNLSSVMKKQKCTPLYDGYTSCPLVTSSKTCILAEFDYDGNPLETLPIDQGKERYTSYGLKAHVMPQLYWRLMTRGNWSGPSTVRRMMRLGLSKSPKMSSSS